MRANKSNTPSTVLKNWTDAFDKNNNLIETPTKPKKMADGLPTVHLRTRNYMNNPLLDRKQMNIDILHPGRANVSKDDLRTQIAKLYKVEKERVTVFGLQTAFGGGMSKGFALIYDSLDALGRFEPHYRKVRHAFAGRLERPSRQQRKQRKNRQKTLRGTAKVKGAAKKKDK